jgi:hypothetical protein
MDNGNTTIKSLMDSTENVEDKHIDFEELDSTKTVEEVADGTDKLTKEQIRISRSIVDKYVNVEASQVLKTIQGSGKSKAVAVAVYYLIEKLDVDNFVYYSNIHDNKLSETVEDLTKEDRITDPFTGEDIVVGDRAEVRYLKGLDRHIKERRDELGIPKNKPIGIYEKENEEPTLLKKLYEDMQWPLDLVLKITEVPDYEGILEEWDKYSIETSDLADSDTPLVVVAPKELRNKSMFQENSWKQYYDEQDYTDTKVYSVEFNEGRINLWKEGLELEEGKLRECVEKIGKFSEEIWAELNEYSLNSKKADEVKEIPAEERVARWKDDGNLLAAKRINLFDTTENFQEDRGFEPTLTKNKIEGIKKDLEMTWGDSDLITDKVEDLADEEKFEKANKLLKVKERIQTLEQFLKYGTFMSETHNYNADKAKSGKTPFTSNDREIECHLWTIKNGFDDVIEDMFIEEKDVNILSASLVEEWMRLKMDRFEKNFSEDYDLPEDLFKSTKIWREDMEVNLKLRLVRRPWKATRTVPDLQTMRDYDGCFKERINNNPERGAISPLDTDDSPGMETGELSWNSDAEGSNELAGVEELFLFFTYTPPTEEFVKVYADIMGELPPLGYNEHAESQNYKEFNIPEELVEKNDMHERKGFTEHELDVVHKCMVNTHINDGLLRGREHHKDKTVYLLGLETDHILEKFDGEVLDRWRLDDLIAHMIVQDEELDRFQNKPDQELIDWIEEKRYDIDGIHPKTLKNKIIIESEDLTLDEGIIKENLTDKQRIFRRSPKDEWLEWREEFMSAIEDGKPKSENKIKEELPKEEGEYEFGDGKVIVEITEKERGALSMPIPRYKFCKGEN